MTPHADSILPELRPVWEVQRAHDVLVAILLREAPLDLPEATMLAINHAAATLCWVLKHEHNRVFAENLAELELLLADAGFGIVDHGRLRYPAGKPQ